MYMLQYYTKKVFNEDPQPTKEPPLERAWVFGSGVTKEELTKLAELYKLDEGILRDVLDKSELPRVEYSQGIAYVFIRAPQQTTRGSIITTPYLSVLKGSMLITLSTKDYIKPEELFGSFKIDMRNTKHVFLQIAGLVIDQYQLFIHNTGTSIRNTEQRLRTHEADNKDFINFVTVEHNLNEFHTNLSALESLLKRLEENRHETFNDKDKELIEDLAQQVNQLLVATNSHLSTVGSIRNAYGTISNNNLNLRMKRLTILTLLVALPNVFYGMYGMNVVLPMADQPWAYWAVVGVSLGIVVFAAMIMRKFKF